ncbi:hypothetical protein JCM10450v2_008046 [Rhodotorula kratochvilovae]
METAAVRRSPRQHVPPLPLAQRTPSPAGSAAPRTPLPAATPPSALRHTSRLSGAGTAQGGSSLPGQGAGALGDSCDCAGLPSTGADKASGAAQGTLPSSGAHDGIPARSALDGAGPRRSTSLPSLLAHLTTAPPFGLSNDAPAALATFHTSPPATYRFPTLSPPQSSTSKRPSSHATPDPHIPSATHLKKRKVRHRFLRSDLLLCGPPPSSPEKRPRARTPASAPWWPSVSRSHGEGTPSRFSREAAPEAHECGTGDGWAAQLVWRFGGLRLAPPGERAREGRGGGRRSRSRGRSRERGAGGRGRREEDPAAAAAGGARPSMPSRANSSPAVFGASGLRTVYEGPPAAQQQEELEGPALKKALLTNLRARMASDGGTSKGAEASLRFKKWAVWNAWRIQTQDPPYVEETPALDTSSSAESDTGTDLGYLGFADHDALDEADNSLLSGIDALPTPPEDYAGLAEQSDGLVEEPATISPLSLLLLPEPEPASAQEESLVLPPLARPPMRRTASLPNVGLAGYVAEEQGHAQPRMGTWEVLRPGAVACEG